MHMEDSLHDKTLDQKLAPAPHAIYIYRRRYSIHSFPLVHIIIYRVPQIMTHTVKQLSQSLLLMHGVSFLPLSLCSKMKYIAYILYTCTLYKTVLSVGIMMPVCH